MPTDIELLRAYADEKSEAAFGELVQRQVNLVYSVALRQCGGDAHLAEDVTQRVFTDLARKARQLSGHAVLGGWLYRSAHFAASDIVRAERRRRAREQEASTMQEIDALSRPAGDADWQKLAPILDQVIGELAARDRDAVVLRFFEGRPFGEIGTALRLTEDAARMRVERALDKLHALLMRRGITSTTAALGLALANQASAIAPAGLAASATGAALAGAAAGGSAGIWLTIFTMGKIKTGIIGTLAAALLVTGVVEVRANRELRAELRALRTDSDDLARLQRDSKQLNAALQKSGANNPDINERTRLQTRLAALRARPDGVTEAAFKPIANAGRATPTDAYVTFAWALNTGDLDGVARLITFRDDSQASRDAFMASVSEAIRTRYRTPERVFAAGLFGIQEGTAWPDPAVSYQVLSAAEDHEPGVMRVKLWIHQAGGRESEMRDTFQRTPEGWSLVFRPLTVEKDAAYVRSRLDPVTGDPRPDKNFPK